MHTPPLGPDFRRLWMAAGASNLGDGLRLVALPLLAAVITRDPLTIAGLTVALRVPGLLFALPAGVIADRIDRRRLLVAVNLFRGVVVAALAIAVGVDQIGIPLLYLVAFLLGTGEIFFDTGMQALIPQVSPREQLERANGRLYATELVANEFVGPPVGSFMFAAAPALPFAADAMSFLSSGLALTRLGGDLAPPQSPRRLGLGSSLFEGLRALWAHAVLRCAVIYSGVRSLLFGAVAGIFVLYALDVLRAGSTGFGMLLAAEAFGGFLGSLAVGRLRKQLGTGGLVLGATMSLGIAYLVLGQVTQAFVGGLIIGLAAFGAVASTVALVSMRQRLVADEFLGRVGSAARLVSIGALAMGSLLGGAFAARFGVPDVFTVAGVGLIAASLIFASPLSNSRIESATVLLSPGSSPQREH